MILANPQAPSTPMPNIVDFHLPCRVCYQDLVYKSVDGECPQCSTPISVSYQRDLMRLAKPQWINQLRAGMNLIIGGVILALLGALVIGAISFLTGRPVEAGESLLIMFASYLMNALGWWALTSPDPSGLGDRQYRFSRAVVRLALLLAIADLAFALLMRSDNLPLNVAHAIGIANLAVLMVAALGYLASFVYLGKIAMRIPDYSLASRAMFLLWGNLVCLAMIAVVAARASTDGHPYSPMLIEMVRVMGPFSALLGFAMLVFAFMFVRLLANLSRELRYQSDWLNQKSAVSLANR
ncbi:MAG TPA: hypothetical protein VMD30_10370 [Tepidisphaeraceae bacterium]|nr:hypothetical protein [Tepidisphaeraceae bacterium]